MRDVEAELIHDMQNTAMVLREAAGQLHENLATLPPGVAAHLTEMLTRRSDMLLRLLRDLSTSHLADRGELDLVLERVSLPDICHELFAEQDPAVGKHLSIDVADDAVAIADPIRLTQVLDNLVTNAIRYGGPNVHVSAAREGAWIRLAVSDDGPGVPDELVDTLFDAYVRGATSHVVGGSGLGMLIVHQLCRAMNGTVEYDATNGACFTATLPAVPAPNVTLGPDVSGAGHSVAFWHDEETLTGSLLAYAAHGLAAGEGVLVAATPEHHKQLEKCLAAVGIDVAAATTTGQYVSLDADRLHHDLPRLQHIDRERFDALVGQTVREVSSRWRTFRVFGEIVDLYWRRSDDHLALELEACWNQLRAELPFPLLCGYELAPGDSAGAISDCHDTVVAA